MSAFVEGTLICLLLRMLCSHAFIEGILTEHPRLMCISMFISEHKSMVGQLSECSSQWTPFVKESKKYCSHIYLE